MQLNRLAREWYALEITTSPAVSAWEASFDGGTTWVASTTVGTDGYSRWLLAGPGADPTGAIVVTERRTQPLVRATASPEVVVRDAPIVYLAAV